MQEMWEPQVWSLGREDPLEEQMAVHSSILAWNNPMDRGASWATVHGVTKKRTQLSIHITDNPSSFMDAFTTELNIFCVFVPTMV